MKLKSSNRLIYTSLETKRNEVELHKEKVDKLQLKLENLLYKQAYLGREIRECKDLQTKNLSKIESDINQSLSIKEFTNQLSEQHSNAINTLTIEMEERKNKQNILEELKLVQQENIDLLDKKRKCLEDIHPNVQQIKTSTIEIKKTLDDVQRITLNNDNIDIMETNI
jgi:hypothetical protein